jgi:vancomycin permeability regulator SanA
VTRRRRRLLCLTLILVVILFPASWFAYLMVSISSCASVQSKVKADAAIVLGNAVRADGRPGPILEGRLEHAVALYRAGRVRAIIFTGGVRYAPGVHGVQRRKGLRP